MTYLRTQIEANSSRRHHFVPTERLHKSCRLTSYHQLRKDDCSWPHRHFESTSHSRKGRRSMSYRRLRKGGFSS